MSRLFPSNEGLADRVIRVLIGVAVLSLAFFGPKTPWAYLGIIPIVTGLLGSCPAYTLLGISTCPMKRSSNAATPR
ncbi:MAG: YgaP family membrane protein [Thermoanaerobaculia bacterium]